MIEKIHKDIQTNLRKYNQEVVDLNPQRMLTWGYEKFDNQFAITTSFGIQSSVLLDTVSKLRLQKKIKIFWIDTGYLPPETYHYAEKLIDSLSLEVEVLQSELSPARMEAKYGKLWETNKESDLDKYHETNLINSVAPPPAESTSFRVFPNPTNQDIAFNLEGWQGRFDWHLQDAAGRVVRSGSGRSIQGGIVQGRIPVQGIPSGVHMLTLTQPGRLVRERVVIFE